MSVTIDQYRDWLGIESPNATPSYYELLGLPPLEADMAKIGAAFQRQTARLTPHLSGNDANAAQRLMGELAEARMTLLTPTAKRAYDQALASRYQAAPSTPAVDELSMVSNPDAILPPAAGPEPAVPQSYPQAGQGFPQASPGYSSYGPAQPAATYPAQGYPAAQAYPSAAQGYLQPGMQGYPAANYPAWPQAHAPAAAYPASPYYAATQPAGYPAGASAAPAQTAPSDVVPMVRRTAARRRSNAVPALAGVAAIVLITLGGLWSYFQGAKAVAVVEPTSDARKIETAGQVPTDERATGERADKPAPDMSKPAATRPEAEKPTVRQPLPVKPEPSKPEPAGQAATATPDKPETAKPEPAKPETAKPEPAKPETAKPEPVKPAVPPSAPPQEPAEMKANADERKKVDDMLKSVRAALAARDVGKARDLLAEATIEATASDTLAEVNHVEVLTDYVEMFWNAVRQTLPKTELEELEVDGKVLNVVEADENHIIVRAEGRNHEYRWQKLPNKLAYYLANRWLREDDPVRNMVLASFEIAEPKGDRANARALLNDASAAGLNAKPLLDELANAAAGKKG